MGEFKKYVGRNLFKGGEFFLDLPDTPPAIMGIGSRLVWARGEPFMLAGPSGVGKTTTTQQIIRGLVGLQDTVLGMPVIETWPVLYAVIDRPAQAQRSMNRMVTEDEREILNTRLAVWKGMLPFHLNKAPERLAAFAIEMGVKAVVLDCLKDAVTKLSDDEAGLAIADSFKYVMDAGIELMILHHHRKTADTSKVPTKLDDVYGSTFITGSCGSVAMLWGDPGDEVVAWRHLKQPGEVVGPMNIVHDHQAGISTAEGWVDLVALAGENGGLTVAAAAMRLFATDSPDKKQIDTARRRLEKLVKGDRLIKHEGGPNGKPPLTYRPFEIVLED